MALRSHGQCDMMMVLRSHGQCDMTMAKVTWSNLYRILAHKNVADCAVLLVMLLNHLFMSSKYTAVYCSTPIPKQPK